MEVCLWSLSQCVCWWYIEKLLISIGLFVPYYLAGIVVFISFLMVFYVSYHIYRYRQADFFIYYLISFSCLSAPTIVNSTILKCEHTGLACLLPNFNRIASSFFFIWGNICCGFVINLNHYYAEVCSLQSYSL